LAFHYRIRCCMLTFHSCICYMLFSYTLPCIHTVFLLFACTYSSSRHSSLNTTDHRPRTYLHSEYHITISHSANMFMTN
jgi:hypothetical protein